MQIDQALTSSTTSAGHSASAPAVASRTRLAGLAGIVVGHLLTVDPNQPQASYLANLGAHQVAGVAGGLTTAAGAFLVLPALTGILGLVRTRGAALASAGDPRRSWHHGNRRRGVLMTLVMGGLVNTDRATAATVFADAGSTAPLLLLTFALAPLLVVGSVIVPFSGGGGPLGALTHLPLGAALARLGARVIRTA